MKIGVIGAGGNIAGAVLGGMLRASFIRPDALFLFDVRKDSLGKYREKGAHICETGAQAVEKSDMIFLAVKPQIAYQVIDEIKSGMTADKCIVSVVAGLSIDSIKKAFGMDCKVIRVMPNTPLLQGKGATGICCLPPVCEQEFQYAQSVFQTAGITVVCEESQMDAVTAVSGSGPAYVFQFAKNVCEEAQTLGLPYEKAMELFCQTLIGSAELLKNSGLSAQALTDMVTSPNGTTYAALQSFAANGFDQVIKDAVKACFDRSKALGKQE